MYLYEDRIRAVELYIKLGKRVRPTIRQLGYPTKNALKAWYAEYQKRLDLPVGYAGREPKFSQAQKDGAIEHYLTHDRCIAATMRAPWATPGVEPLPSGFVRFFLKPGRLSLEALANEGIPSPWSRPRGHGALHAAGKCTVCCRQALCVPTVWPKKTSKSSPTNVGLGL